MLLFSRWNFSVGQHKLTLSNVHSDVTRNRLRNEDESIELGIQVSIPEGIVAQKSDSEMKKILWEQPFKSPIAAVWLLQNGVLEELDLLKITVPPKSLNENNEMPLMYYIGKNSQLPSACS